MSPFYRNALIAVVLLPMFFGCVPPKEYRHYDGVVWTTSFHITYSSQQPLDDSIQTVFSQIQTSLSMFDSTSVVSRINRCATVSTDSLFRLTFLTASEVNRASGGVYDPTVKPLVDLWGFGSDRDTPAPSDAEIALALESVGIGDCRIVADSIIKKSLATSFDFSSIAKGLACDLIGRMMERNGVVDYMVEIGGEIALSGVNPKGVQWSIMIDAPIENLGAPTHQKLTILSLTDCGVATSGNYRNFRTIDGHKVGHTIDPRSGRFHATTTASATIIASDAMTADALATACMLLPAGDAVKMVDEWHDAEALLVVTLGDGSMQTLTTSGFPIGH